MLITPSFKKSLIVEQFQGNYPKALLSALKLFDPLRNRNTIHSDLGSSTLTLLWSLRRFLLNLSFPVFSFCLQFLSFSLSRFFSFFLSFLVFPFVKERLDVGKERQNMLRVLKIITTVVLLYYAYQIIANEHKLSLGFLWIDFFFISVLY